MSATEYPHCSDTRDCMFRTKTSKCKVLNSTYDGAKKACPYCKPREETKS